MASTIWEFFGYRSTDTSQTALQASEQARCPFIDEPCEKTINVNNERKRSGVCTIKPTTSEPVICCPIRLYADGYQILRDVADKAFSKGLPLINGRKALEYSSKEGAKCVAVFGQRWGGELRLPQKSGKGGYFVDWVLALIDANGQLEEFVAIEVQTIDTTGNYREGVLELESERQIIKTSAGLNWENVSKRILPQIIYKGQVLQREDLCRKGLFFICPAPVYSRILDRLGGQSGLAEYSLQPASITFMSYHHSESDCHDGQFVPIELDESRSTTVYKVQEAFNNVTLPDRNVYESAIRKALGFK
ncbi:NotI family restriction endonuclease [Kushneria phyllosphaerae]|uniref:Restriction endonuclease type II NotI domain-containing protein n=1 Tax=Kushneria phyllosphaerae TaxID=2100822 RepID=A0A2R8CQQ0_9GAMM|nr:NotI family restriction endonuclease [Kushneria phyllosphaerae]SPJ35238.1 hypothetical protein KSP9073_03296 [Kushneria phyllosphaerae]